MTKHTNDSGRHSRVRLEQNRLDCSAARHGQCRVQTRVATPLSMGSDTRRSSACPGHRASQEPGHAREVRT